MKVVMMPVVLLVKRVEVALLAARLVVVRVKTPLLKQGQETVLRESGVEASEGPVRWRSTVSGGLGVSGRAGRQAVLVLVLRLPGGKPLAPLLAVRKAQVAEKVAEGAVPTFRAAALGKEDAGPAVARRVLSGSCRRELVGQRHIRDGYWARRGRGGGDLRSRHGWWGRGRTPGTGDLHIILSILVLSSLLERHVLEPLIRSRSLHVLILLAPCGGRREG